MDIRAALATAGETRRRAGAQGAAAGLLLGAGSFDLASLVVGGPSPTARAFGLGIGFASTVALPVVLRTAHLARTALLAAPAAPTVPVVEPVVEPVAEPAVLAAPAAPAAPPLSIEIYLLAGDLARVRHELAGHARRLASAERAGRLWGYDEQVAADEAWREVRAALAGTAVAGLDLYDTVADAYVEVARIRRVNALRTLLGEDAEVAESDRLGDAVAAVERAVEQIHLVLDVVAEAAYATGLAVPPAPETRVIDLRDEHADAPRVAEPARR